MVVFELLGTNLRVIINLYCLITNQKLLLFTKINWIFPGPYNYLERGEGVVALPYFIVVRSIVHGYHNAKEGSLAGLCMYEHVNAIHQDASCQILTNPGWIVLAFSEHPQLWFLAHYCYFQRKRVAFPVFLLQIFMPGRCVRFCNSRENLISVRSIQNIKKITSGNLLCFFRLS